MKVGPGTNQLPKYSARVGLTSCRVGVDQAERIMEQLRGHPWIVPWSYAMGSTEGLIFDSCHLRIDVHASHEFSAETVERELRYELDRGMPGLVHGIVLGAVQTAGQIVQEVVVPTAQQTVAAVPAVVDTAARASSGILTPVALAAGAIALVIFLWKR